MQEAETRGTRQVVPRAVGLGCPPWARLPGGGGASALQESRGPPSGLGAAVAGRLVVVGGAAQGGLERQHLPLHQPGVEAALGQQLLVGALLHHAALVQHHDEVRPLHRAQPVRDDEHRALLQVAVDGLLDLGAQEGRACGVPARVPALPPSRDASPLGAQLLVCEARARPQPAAWASVHGDRAQCPQQGWRPVNGSWTPARSSPGLPAAPASHPGLGQRSPPAPEAHAQKTRTLHPSASLEARIQLLANPVAAVAPATSLCPIPPLCHHSCPAAASLPSSPSHCPRGLHHVSSVLLRGPQRLLGPLRTEPKLPGKAWGWQQTQDTPFVHPQRAPHSSDV